VQRDGSVYKFAEKIIVASLATEKELMLRAKQREERALELKEEQEKAEKEVEAEEGSEIGKGEGESNDL
jgi:hypothetical protein